MAGGRNVWEWCADTYDPTYYDRSPVDGPQGPDVSATRVLRGGSYLCHDSYCNRYRDRSRQQDPDCDVLSRAGFEAAGRYDFPTGHHWTVHDVAGHIRSTSVLPPSVLAEHAAEFDADLTAALSRHTIDDHVSETVDFAYELARKPTPAASG